MMDSNTTKKNVIDRPLTVNDLVERETFIPQEILDQYLSIDDLRQYLPPEMAERRVPSGEEIQKTIPIGVLIQYLPREVVWTYLTPKVIKVLPFYLIGQAIPGNQTFYDSRHKPIKPIHDLNLVLQNEILSEIMTAQAKAYGSKAQSSTFSPSHFLGFLILCQIFILPNDKPIPATKYTVGDLKKALHPKDAPIDWHHILNEYLDEFSLIFRDPTLLDHIKKYLVQTKHNAFSSALLCRFEEAFLANPRIDESCFFTIVVKDAFHGAYPVIKVHPKSASLAPAIAANPEATIATGAFLARYIEHFSCSPSLIAKLNNAKTKIQSDLRSENKGIAHKVIRLDNTEAYIVVVGSYANKQDTCVLYLPSNITQEGHCLPSEHKGEGVLDLSFFQGHELVGTGQSIPNLGVTVETQAVYNPIGAFVEPTKKEMPEPNVGSGLQIVYHVVCPKTRVYFIQSRSTVEFKNQPADPLCTPSNVSTQNVSSEDHFACSGLTTKEGGVFVSSLKTPQQPTLQRVQIAVPGQMDLLKQDVQKCFNTLNPSAAPQTLPPPNTNSTAPASLPPSRSTLERKSDPYTPNPNAAPFRPSAAQEGQSGSSSHQNPAPYQPGQPPRTRGTTHQPSNNSNRGRW